MRDVILFILILMLSAGAASFAPSSASIGATHEVKPVLVQKQQIRAQRKTSKDIDLRKSLEDIEERCDTLESAIIGDLNAAK